MARRPWRGVGRLVEGRLDPALLALETGSNARHGGHDGEWRVLCMEVASGVEDAMAGGGY